MKVKDLITSRSRWCKGYFAKDRLGNEVNPDSPFAARFCLVGGLTRCYPDLKKRAAAVRKLKRILFPVSISVFNDEVATFPDIQRVLRKANV